MADPIPGQPGASQPTTAAETTPVPVTPAPAPAAAPVTPDGAQGAADSQQPTTTQPAPDVSAPVDWSKVDAGAYADIKRQMLEQQGKPAAPVPPPPVQTEPVPPVETPAAPEPPAAAVPEPAAPVPEGEDEGPFGNKFRPRLGKLPARQQEAIQLVRQMTEAGKPITLAEAESKVLAKYGEDKPPDATPAVALPSLAEIDKTIKEKRAALTEAGKTADVEALARLTIELEEARDQKSEVIEHEGRQQRQSASAVNAAKADVRALYPDFGKPDSALSQKFTELFDQMKVDDDPILSLSPDRQLRTIARLAAVELGIRAVDTNAPRTPATPAAPPKAPASTVPPTPPAQRPVQPASGSARTSAPANATAQLVQQVQSLKTVDAYQAFKDSLVARPAGR